jgi:hypothetical protein
MGEDGMVAIMTVSSGRGCVDAGSVVEVAGVHDPIVAIAR